MAELYHFKKIGHEGDSAGDDPADRASSPEPPPLEKGRDAKPARLAGTGAAALRDTLPGLGSLPPAERRALLIRQVRQDLPQLWVQTPDSPALTPALSELDEKVVEAGAATDDGTFRARIRKIHDDLQTGLTVCDFRLGKSYGLGRSLAETTIIPCALATGHSLLRGRSDNDRGAAFREALGREFSGGRVFTLQAWLHDLRDCFAEYAADAVATTVGGWGLWVIRPTLAKGQPVNWQDAASRGPVERALRRQGDVWRGLLSGEKDPENIVSADYYFAAVASLLRRLALLSVRFLGTSIGLVLVLLVVVAGIALVFAAAAKNSTGVLAGVLALLSALGITTGSTGATVKKAWAKAEKPLWRAELAAAVANATWHNPAPLGSIDEIQLLLTVGEKADPETETRARHPGWTVLRALPVGRLGIVLMVVSTAVALFAADAGRLQADAAFFIPPLCIVSFLALIDGWDLLIGLATRQTAPYLALPERIEVPDWLEPSAQYLAPLLLVASVVASHFFWH